jgi:alanine-glyoxylate transaminase / serine-glyoxylate transaminase / serine-pyruvate transaminase
LACFGHRSRRPPAATITDVLTDRLLLGSGPSPVPQRVLDALGRPPLGHLDPAFGEVMDEVGELLRATFRADNRTAYPVSATGSGGMQTMVDNLIRPGDRVVCGVHGMFGERMADAMTRRGADVIRVDGEWGRAIPTEQLLDATREPFAALFVVHGETSTGVVQPLDALAEACAQHGALLLIDCVTSLAGHPLDLDAAGVDAAFSGSQKCLNCPAGLAPFTANERALERVQGSPSWFFDLTAVMGYWQAESARAYHHTAPTNMVVALREALRIVQEEGLEPRWARHEKAHEALRRALAELGFERIAPDGEHLYPLLAMRLPEGVDDAATRRALLTEHGIEVAAASGPFAGQAWRIGVMGEGARPEPQERLVSAVAQLTGREAKPALDALADGWA